MSNDRAAVLEDFVTLEGMLRAFRSELGLELRVTVVGEEDAPARRPPLFSLPGPGLLLERLSHYQDQAIVIDPDPPEGLLSAVPRLPLLAIACCLNVGAMLLALLALLLSH